MAVVSGPGALSQRTDMGAMGGSLSPNNPIYVEGADLQQMKQTAPLAGTGTNAGGQGASAAPQGIDPSSLTGLAEASQRPDEHVTAGATYTPGQPAGNEDSQSVAAMDPGLINVLLRQASLPGADRAFQRYVRLVYSNLQ